jgi:uncharacterized protein YkwD
MEIALIYTARCLVPWALCAAASAHGASAFDASINRLFITSVSVNGASYQNVSATLNSFTVLGVDGGTAGADTFNPVNNLLTLGSVVFQGATYNNVRVQLNSYSLLAATLVIPSPGTSAPGTPVTPTTPTAPTAPSSPTPAPDSGTTEAHTCSLSNFQSDLMALINQARATSQVCGSTTYPAAPSVAWNSKLFNAAAGHSADMANQNYFSHTSLDGRAFDQRITAAGYAWSNIGENIAAGQSSVSSVMAGWMASPGHCANIMNNRFAEVGVACVINNSSTYRSYWTMNLGRP